MLDEEQSTVVTGPKFRRLPSGTPRGPVAYFGADGGVQRVPGLFDTIDVEAQQLRSANTGPSQSGIACDIERSVRSMAVPKPALRAEDIRGAPTGHNCRATRPSHRSRYRAGETVRLYGGRTPSRAPDGQTGHTGEQ